MIKEAGKASDGATGTLTCGFEPEVGFEPRTFRLRGDRNPGKPGVDWVQVTRTGTPWSFRSGIPVGNSSAGAMARHPALWSSKFPLRGEGSAS
jgi:hypothetical protein